MTEINTIQNYTFKLFNKTYVMFVSDRELESAKKFFDDLNNGVDFNLAKIDFVKSYLGKILKVYDTEVILKYYNSNVNNFFYEKDVNKIYSIWETYTKAKNRENIIEDIFKD